MSKIFTSRNFVEAFSTRNVVFEQSASFDKCGTFIVRSSMEFANNGRINRASIIQTKGLSVHNIHTQLGKYQGEILEIIDILECYRDWLKTSGKTIFSRVLCCESPLYFHGQVTKGTPSLAIYGKGLVDLELFGKTDRHGESASFSMRIKELIECYRTHLMQLDNIPAATFHNAYLIHNTHLAKAV